MPKRVYAMVKPELLAWARASAGLSLEDAAKAAGVTPSRLADWETNPDSHPTLGQLRNLGRAYKRPIAVFFLPEPPMDFQPLRDYRRLPGVIAGVESPGLRFAIRAAHARRDVALELLELEDSVPGFTARAELAEDPEAVATRLRKLLGADGFQPATWRSAYDPLNAWRDAAEGAGTLVFQAQGVSLDEARGFSIAHMPLPAIVLNLTDRPRARAFTLLHEFTHVLLRQGGLCDLGEDQDHPPEARRVEVFCNRAASATLLPRASLLHHPVIAGSTRPRTWTDEEIQAVASAHGVSREVVVARLVAVDLASPSFFERKLRQYREEYRVAAEREQEGFAPPYRIAVSTAGPSFTRLVLSSYYENRITASDVSDYLGVRMKHLPRIEQAVALE